MPEITIKLEIPELGTPFSRGACRLYCPKVFESYVECDSASDGLKWLAEYIDGLQQHEEVVNRAMDQGNYVRYSDEDPSPG